MRTKPLYNQTDARNMADAMISMHGKPGEIRPNAFKMDRMAASVTALYFARPARLRGVKLVDAGPGYVILKRSCDA